MKPSNETLMAFIDGELSVQEAARVALVLAADPELARRVEQQRRLRVRLKGAYAPVLDQPVPERLWAAAGYPGVRPTATGTAAASRVRRWSWPQWAAVAASLVVGVVLAQLLPAQPAQGPFATSSEGWLLARNDLARHLEQAPSGAGEHAGAIAMGFSFRDHEGRACRTFVIGHEAASAGLACRHAGDWRVSMLVEAPQPPATEMRMAGSALPAALLREVDARISGDPLDQGEEARAIEGGWR
jgi:hypothetical protein